MSADPKVIDKIVAVVGVADGEKIGNHLEHAMALTLLAAHHVVHDGGSEDDFVAVARAAWRRSLTVHEGCKS